MTPVATWSLFISIGCLKFMEIVKYKFSYLEALLRTWEEATTVGHPFLSQNFVKSEKKNIEFIYFPNGDTWLVLMKGKVVGFTILHGSEVGTLYIDPELHGREIEYAQMNKAQAIHRDLIVEVFKDNDIAIKLYTRFGFRFLREYLHADTWVTILCLELKTTT
jgi:putative acetyltransferase